MSEGSSTSKGEILKMATGWNYILIHVWDIGFLAVQTYGPIAPVGILPWLTRKGRNIALAPVVEIGAFLNLLDKIYHLC